MKKILMFIVFNIIAFYTINIVQNNIIQKQNFLNVQAVYNCLKDNHVNSEKLMKKYLNLCIKYIRNLSEMGDMFIMRVKDKKIIWDASQDCKLDNNKSYLKKGYICDLFYKPESCIILSNKMQLKKEGYGEWYFYNTPELIYFKRIDINGTDYVIASGGEKIDIVQLFVPIYILIILIDIVFLIIIKRGLNEDITNNKK